MKINFYKKFEIILLAFIMKSIWIPLKEYLIKIHFSNYISLSENDHFFISSRFNTNQYRKTNLKLINNENDMFLCFAYVLRRKVPWLYSKEYAKIPICVTKKFDGKRLILMCWSKFLQDTTMHIMTIKNYSHLKFSFTENNFSRYQNFFDCIR